MKKSAAAMCIGAMAFLLLYEIYRIAEHFLERADLQLRPWVDTAMLFILAACIGVILVSAVIWLIGRIREHEKVWKKIADGILIAALICGMAAGGMMLTVAYAFGHEPEHVVQKDGAAYVACVIAFTDTSVAYYDYHGPFAMGKNWALYENYGDGCFDPITDGGEPIQVYEQ